MNSLQITAMFLGVALLITGSIIHDGILFAIGGLAFLGGFVDYV